MNLARFVFFWLLPHLTWAQIDLQTVSNQFLNIHGANWQTMAKSEQDWVQIRALHEQIIEQPAILTEVFPQAGMVDYLYPIAIHSYGKLIGEGSIPLDDNAQKLLFQLASKMPPENKGNSLTIIEAIALTNSPWGVEILTGLIDEANPEFNDAIFKQLAHTMERFDKTSHDSKDLDAKLEFARIDYRQNAKEWDQQIYKIRKKASDYLRAHPKFKQNSSMQRLMKTSQQAAQFLQHRLASENPSLSKDSQAPSDNPPSTKSSPAKTGLSTAKPESKMSAFSWYIFLGLSLLILGIFILLRKKD